MICPNIRVVGNRFLSSCPQLGWCRCGQCELTASGCLSVARCGGEEGREEERRLSTLFPCDVAAVDSRDSRDGAVLSPCLPSPPR